MVAAQRRTWGLPTPWVAVALFLAACSSSGAEGSSTDTAAVSSSVTVAEVPRCGGSVDVVETFQYRSIDDVDPNLVSLDVHRPAAAAGCPLVVYVHGGSWQAGDKATRATNVKADHLVEAGFVFVSVNYRLASASNDVRWPTFGDDVAAAIDWVMANAAALGGDGERVSIVGHSSGAHLVSIVGTNPDLLGAFGRERDDVTCVVSLDSVDHTLADAPTYETDIVRLAFGDDPAVLADGSPTVQARDHRAPFPEFLIVTRGRDVRIESSQRLSDAIVTGGGSASVLDVSPYDHRDANVRFGEPGESMLTEPVTEFLTECALT